MWVERKVISRVVLMPCTHRSDVQRTFKIEDANEILTHVPFVATRVESPETTAEELIEIVRKVGDLFAFPDQPIPILPRSKRRPVGAKRPIVRT